MELLTVSMSELVDRALLELHAPSERGLRVVIGDDALGATDTTTFTLSHGAEFVNRTDVIEFGNELVLVTGKSDDLVPVFTAARGYFGTEPGEYLTGVDGTVNPPFPRFRVAEGVRRSFPRLDALGVHVVKSDVVLKEFGQAYALLPAGTKDVYDVWYFAPGGRLVDLDRWRFDHSLPTDRFPTGAAVRLPYYVEDGDELHIRFRVPYRWDSFPDPPSMDSQILVPEGAEDLPALYAACFMVSAREVSRHEIDRSEEWARTADISERGSPGALVRAKWQEFYRALDEARRVNHVPARRTYRPMPKVRL
jgi:hypothetical protein